MTRVHMTRAAARQRNAKARSEGPTPISTAPLARSGTEESRVTSSRPAAPTGPPAGIQDQSPPVADENNTGASEEPTSVALQNAPDHWKCLRHLGVGGYGNVYLAEYEGKQVAVKQLGPGVPASSLVAEQLAGRCHHRNIIKYIRLEYWDGVPTLISEYCEGINLEEYMDQLVEEGSVMPLPKMKSITTQLLSGIAHLIEQGITHRDLKPANIMILPDGTLKILDFGVAHGPDSEDIGLAGTRIFIPGSVILLNKLGIESTMEFWDLNSVGVIVILMYTLCETPFPNEDKGEGFMDSLLAHAKDGKLEPDLQGIVSKRMVAFVRGCMNLDYGVKWTAATALDNEFLHAGNETEEEIYYAAYWKWANENSAKEDEEDEENEETEEEEEEEEEEAGEGEEEEDDAE
eukprot:TRINITY_DN6307_c0_g1_i2.p1 TRINITY_DN6307_c0_g1~~TRINITY_DN6307_c0_g1_i2.p1  ORF type:complete len:432 (+),score=68.60 TRINITY_DN6307_c0_g1_i2:87-1298(+)